ncbi:MAG: hypothetical protein M1169_05630 [Firmicutes bacterium]|nr:hypothetical protein [Bacillota bacterium]
MTGSVLEGTEVREELFDGRLQGANDLIRKIQSKRTLSSAERDSLVNDLKKLLKSIKGRRGIIRGRELRAFLRVVTGFTLLRNPGAVNLMLEQLNRNPDQRLISKATNYFRYQEKNLKKISTRLTEMLIKSDELFPYQTAHFLMMLRFMREITPEAWKRVDTLSKRRSEHWYVRQQAVSLLGTRPFNNVSLQAAAKSYYAEEHPQVKRTWLKALAQLPKTQFETIVGSLVFSVSPELQRIGRLFYGLMYDDKRGQDQIKSLLNDFREEIFIDRVHEAEALARAQSMAVRENLLKKLKWRSKIIRRPLLRQRVHRIIESLEAQTDRSAAP